METITSTQNPKIKELRKLHDRKHRDRSGLFMAEGEDMLSAALGGGAMPQVVFYDPQAESRLEPLLAPLVDVELVPVAAEVLANAGSLGSGSRVIGVWGQRWTAVERLGAGDGSAIYLNELSDPGNVGTILRSALAFGARSVVLSERCADPFGPKAVRASMGAVFTVPVARADLAVAASATGLRTVALVPGSGADLRTVAEAGPGLYVLGSEREGLPDRIAAACDETAQVRMASGAAESLNVAMTATLCLYEDAIHRLPGPDGPQGND